MTAIVDVSLTGTFSSTELQQIVSRAIRSSARESFIRLLTVENLDNILPTELERLERSKASTQSKYRFLVHRRTMLLQALITSAQIPSAKDKDKVDNMDSITKLALQLSETTAECDRLSEDLLKISDQTAQINRMLDVHWASALAIALRKVSIWCSFFLRPSNVTNSSTMVMVEERRNSSKQENELLSWRGN